MSGQSIPSCGDCLRAHKPIRVEYLGQHLVCSYHSMRVSTDGPICPQFSSVIGLMNQMDKCIGLAEKILEKGSDT